MNIISILVVALLLSYLVFGQFDDECNGVYSATTGKQEYPIDVCEASRINGVKQSDRYYCSDEGGVMFRIWKGSSNCTGIGNYNDYPAYQPNDPEWIYKCDQNNITTICDYAIVRSHFNTQQCALGNISLPNSDYSDKKVPVNRCRYNSDTDISTKIECNNTAIYEMYYNGNGCSVKIADSEPTVIYYTGCDEDYNHPQFPNRKSYDEITYCPSSSSNCNILSAFISFIIGIFIIML